MNHVELANNILDDQKELKALRHRVNHLERVIKATVITHGNITWKPVEYLQKLDDMVLFEGMGRWTINNFEDFKE